LQQHAIDSFRIAATHVLSIPPRALEHPSTTRCLTLAHTRFRFRDTLAPRLNLRIEIRKIARLDLSASMISKSAAFADAS
jgi:hypothetical protein